MFLIPDSVGRFFHRMASPPHFYAFTEKLLPWLTGIFLILLACGLYGGLYLAPPDYQQGDSYRIIYIHVPSAWMSLFIYMMMAVAGAIGLIWRIKLAEIVAISSASVGASFTFIALVTGSLWGKPMWGTWWIWDARLTSELILLFLYAAILATRHAYQTKEQGDKIVAILTLVGLVDLPVIHYSVEWWNTLHQGPTVTKMDKPSIHVSMLVPLLLMALAFKFYYVIAMLQRAKLELLQRERTANWVKKLIEEQK